MSDKHDFTIEKGATFRQNILWRDNAGGALDLTDYTARMQIRREFKSDIIHEMTTENGGIVITALTGEIDLLIEANVSDLFNSTSAKYDLELTKGSEVTRLIQGAAFITENVTR